LPRNIAGITMRQVGAATDRHQHSLLLEDGTNGALEAEAAEAGPCRSSPLLVSVRGSLSGTSPVARRPVARYQTSSAAPSARSPK
jgi:hypothetical protein